MKMALITPTYAKDRELLDISCAQVDRHCQGNVEHFVIPSHSEKVMFKHLSGKHRHVIYKEDIFDLSVRRLPFKVLEKEIFLFNHVFPVRGWVVPCLSG
jgi:hypothetical protein